MVTTTVNFDRKAKRGSTIYRAKIDFASGDLTTSGTNSGVIDLEGLDEVTFWFEHTSDQAITVKIFDAPDPQFSRGNVHQLGNDINLSAGDSTAQYDRQTLSQTSQIARINASADSSNATTGTLTVHVRGRTD